MRTFSRLIRAYKVTDETYWSKLRGGDWKLTHIEYRWRDPEGTGNYEPMYFLSPVDRNSPESPVSVGSISFDMNWQKVETESKEQN